MTDITDARATIEVLAEIEDFGLPWGFKGVKGLLMWPLLHDCFPRAKWVVVVRDRAEHVQSLLRTSFMTAYSDSIGWNSYMDEIDAHIDSLTSSGVNYSVFSPAKLRDPDDKYLEDFCRWCGLEYNPRSKGVYDKKLYRKVS